MTASFLPPILTPIVTLVFPGLVFALFFVLEDYVTWVDTSKIKRKVAAYNDKLDDYDLLGE